MVKLVFGYLATAIVILSILVVISRKAVHSVLWMLLLFFHIAGVYIFLNAEFLAATQVIVYAGAILVLFLFVIMLINLKEDIEIEQFVGGWPIGISMALSILITLLLGLNGFKSSFTGEWSIENIEKITHTKALGKVLFTEYLLPFEIASIILLVAIVGAVVLAKKKLRS